MAPKEPQIETMALGQRYGGLAECGAQRIRACRLAALERTDGRLWVGSTSSPLVTAVIRPPPRQHRRSAGRSLSWSGHWGRRWLAVDARSSVGLDSYQSSDSARDHCVSTTRGIVAEKRELAEVQPSSARAHNPHPHASRGARMASIEPTPKQPQESCPSHPPAAEKKSIEESKALIRAVISLFAALVGFGMQAVLQSADPDIHAARFWLFLVLALYALRILSGASVHLIASHHSAFRSAWSLLVDICVLFVLAVALVFVANQKSLSALFCWFLVIPAMSCAWAWMDNQLVKRLKSRNEHEGSTALKTSFVKINLAYFVGLVIIVCLDRFASNFSACLIFGVRSTVALLVVLSIGIAIYDLYKQYKVVEAMVQSQ